MWVRELAGLQTRGLIKLGGTVVVSWLGGWPDLASQIKVASSFDFKRFIEEAIFKAKGCAGSETSD
jgi:hypothetical protein